MLDECRYQVQFFDVYWTTDAAFRSKEDAQDFLVEKIATFRMFTWRILDTAA